MDIVREIKDFVESECKKPENIQGYDPFVFHFIPVAEYAEKLVDELGGDKEVILIAAWLHDIGSIIHGRDNHHITSVKIAEQKLKEFQYSAEKIELVKKCILNHRGSQRSNRESIEEQIIAEADTLACFDDIAGVFQAAFCWEGHKSRESALISVREKLKRKWSQLHFGNSKRLIKPKFEAAMLLLK
jgi:uncharacterized protein